MKRLYIIVVLSCLSYLSFSQLRMAVTGGPHSANIKEENNLPMWESTMKPGYSAKSGLHLGVLVEVPLSGAADSRWFFQPGIQYMAKGRKFFMRTDTTQSLSTDTISSSHTLAVNYIEIPLNLTYKIPISKKTKFLLSAGPYIGFFYNGKQRFETRLHASNGYRADEINLETGRADGKINTFDAGFNARGGFEIGSVMLTGFFSQGLTDFYHAPYQASLRHQVKGVSLGIWLNKTKPAPATIKDSDSDGIADLTDECPKIAGPQITNGCPDRDDDGIADHQDACPDVPGTVRYKGCPVPDNDGDGMNNESDACPDLAGVVEFNGCPVPDSDGDGLNDLLDKCQTEAGPLENKGCPLEVADTVRKKAEEKLQIAARQIFFTKNSDQLTPDSYQPLSDVAEQLKQHPTFDMEIEGHTDSTGSAEINLILSQKRAESVKNFLVAQGISSDRIVTKGFGPSRPVAPNSTAAGRLQNRRVEMRLIRK